MDLIIGFNPKKKLMRVFLSEKMASSGKYKLVRTSKKSIKGFVYKNKVMGFRVDFNKTQCFGCLGNLLMDELGLDENLVENLLNEVAACPFSDHNLSDTIH